VVSNDPLAFGRWRGSPVAIAGLYGDVSVAAQAQQWQFTHSRFTGDVDLAVGAPRTTVGRRRPDGRMDARNSC
jgi:hypothetical protein